MASGAGDEARARPIAFGDDARPGGGFGGPDGRDWRAVSACDARTGGAIVPAAAVRRDSGGIVVPRGGLADRMRTRGRTSSSACAAAASIECSAVDCGARPRGSGATSPAPCIGGTVDVIRGGCIDANRSSASPGGTDGLPWTRSMSALTAVDSVFAMRREELPRRLTHHKAKTLTEAETFTPRQPPYRFCTDCSIVSIR
jgi:hypothetical protein